MDSKLEDITIDTKSPVITTVTFDSLIKNNTSITSSTPGYDDTRAQPNDTVIFKITSNEPLYEISTSDVTINRMSVSSVTPNEDFTEWKVTSEVIDAET